MLNNGTVAVTRETKERLNKLKVHPREPFNDVIKKLLDKYEKGNLEK